MRSTRRADLARGLRRRLSRVSGAQHQHALRRALQVPRSNLDRQAPRDDRHGREQRKAPAGLAHHLEGDRGGAARRETPRSIRLSGQLLEGKQRLAGAQPQEIRVLHFLHLHDERRVPGIADASARGAIRVVVEAACAAGERLDHHFMTRAREARHMGRREAHAALAFLRLARNADLQGQVQGATGTRRRNRLDADSVCVALESMFDPHRGECHACIRRASSPLFSGCIRRVLSIRMQQ